MPLDVLESHSELSIRYDPPRRRQQMHVYVEASPNTRVDVYILTAKGMREYNRDEDDEFEMYEQSTNRRVHELTVTPDPGEPWYLLIDNRYAQGTHVYFDVR